MTTLQDLLERVEKAEGSDWRLMMDVARAAYPEAYPDGWVYDSEVADWRFLRFEKWVGAEAWDQAALALVERKLPGWTWRLDSPDSASEPAFARLSGPEWRSGAGWAKTPALALLAALLRALIAQGEAEQKAG